MQHHPLCLKRYGSERPCSCVAERGADARDGRQRRTPARVKNLEAAFGSSPKTLTDRITSALLRMEREAFADATLAEEVEGLLREVRMKLIRTPAHSQLDAGADIPGGGAA